LTASKVFDILPVEEKSETGTGSMGQFTVYWLDY